MVIQRWLWSLRASRARMQHWQGWLLPKVRAGWKTTASLFCLQGGFRIPQSDSVRWQGSLHKEWVYTCSHVNTFMWSYIPLETYLVLLLICIIKGCICLRGPPSLRFLMVWALKRWKNIATSWMMFEEQHCFQLLWRLAFRTGKLVVGPVLRRKFTKRVITK